MSIERPEDRSVQPDGIPRLIEAAGPRDDHAAAVESLRRSARDAWHAGLERDRRVAARWRRALLLAAALMLLTAGGWLALRFGDRDADRPPRPELAIAVRAGGEVAVVGADGVVRPLTAGQPLREGDRIETLGSRVALSLGESRSVRLDRATSLELVSADRLALSRGAVYVSSGPGTARALSVATPHGLAREVGTRFAVALDDKRLAIRVREGSVVLESAGERIEVTAGEEVSRDAAGAIDRKPLSPSDPTWEWVVVSAPPFELEGATAEEYLAWVEREAGWRVLYVDSDAKRQAAAAVLHGSLEGFDPRDTLELVLPSADLAFLLAGDELRVRVASAGADP